MNIYIYIYIYIIWVVIRPVSLAKLYDFYVLANKHIIDNLYTVKCLLLDLSKSIYRQLGCLNTVINYLIAFRSTYIFWANLTTDPAKDFLWSEDAYYLLLPMVTTKSNILLMKGSPSLLHSLVATVAHNKSYVSSDRKKSLSGSVVMFAQVVLMLLISTWGLKFMLYYDFWNWEAYLLQIYH